MSLVIITGALVLFFGWTLPRYQSFSDLRAQASTLEEVLENSRRIQEVTSDLNERVNAISPQDLQRLERVVPNSINNVQLIIELQNIAERNRLALLNIDSSNENDNLTGNLDLAEQDDYQTELLQFELVGTYENFVNFIEDVESNIRITDVKDISFSLASVDEEATTQDQLVYNFQVQVATYWRSS